MQVDDRAVVLLLQRAWELAARSVPPIWASEYAEMPRLSRLNTALALDTNFTALSPAAQIIAMQVAAWGGARAVVGPWCLLAASNNLHLAEARRAVAELEASGWATCGEGGFTAATTEGFHAIRINERALCTATYGRV